MPRKWIGVFTLMSLLLCARTCGYRFLSQSSWARTVLPSRLYSTSPLVMRAKFNASSRPSIAEAISEGTVRLETKPARHRNSKYDDEGSARTKFLTSVKARDFDGAAAAFHELTLQKHIIRDHDYLALLGVCFKAEHLPTVSFIMEKLKNRPDSSKVPAFLSLIRCYTDAGKLNDAVSVIQEMVTKKVELRPRLFQPLLEALSSNGDLQRTLAVTKYMLALKVTVNEDQLVPLLGLLGQESVRQKLAEDTTTRETMHAVIAEIAKELMGVYHTNALEILRTVNGLSAEQVEQQGVLVETAADIPGDVLTSTLAVDGQVIALNATYSEVGTLLRDVTAVLDNEHDSANRRLDFQSVPQLYTVLYENNTRRLLNSNNNSRTNRQMYARLVDISSRTCRCPNCDRAVLPLTLSEEDKAHVRDELFKLVRLSRGNMLNNLNDFGRWLRAREEYDYIVDGANVAYNGQNFEAGRFSFEQIGLVVDKLTEMGKRVLVVVPEAYMHERVPNHSKAHKDATTYVSDEDKRVVAKLRDADMLFVVPPGSNDDWYWLYATIYEGRRSPAFVVSNDYMRDHRPIFTDMKAFMRWRSQQIVYFSFSKSVAPEATRERNYEMPVASLFLPEKISREIQRTDDSWHIPTVDRDTWLCVSLTPTDNDQAGAVGGDASS